MTLPPMLVRVRFRSLRLWLPLFLLWPIVLVLAIPFLVIGMIVLLFVNGPTVRETVRFCGGLYTVLCQSRGTSVSVDGPTEHIAFTLF